MWEQCNNELHGRAIKQQQILHSLANEQIRKMYAGGTQQLPRDALHFLQTPMEITLAYPLASKQLWVESVKLAQQ